MSGKRNHEHELSWCLAVDSSAVRGRHLSVSKEMPLHLLSFGIIGSSSACKVDAMNYGAAATSQHQAARPTCGILHGVLQSQHDQWLFLKDLDFR